MKVAGKVIEMLWVLAVVGGAIATAVAAIRHRRADKLRVVAVQAFAKAHDFLYYPRSPERAAYFSSPPFATGFDHEVHDVVVGAFDGRVFETFAYRYKERTYDAKGRPRTRRYRFQVTWVPLAAPLPTMRFTADDPVMRLGAKLGARDLNTESHDFNQRWKVWCDDERAGHAVLTPRMIERFLAPDLTDRPITINGAAVMTYQTDHTQLTGAAQTVALLGEIADLIPPFLFAAPSPPPASAPLPPPASAPLPPPASAPLGGPPPAPPA